MSIRAMGVYLGMLAASGILLSQAATPGQNGASASEPSIHGNLMRGQAIFEGKGRCLTCHRVANHGSRLGPDLSEIGARDTVVQLQKALLDPDPEVKPQNQLYEIVTRDGARFTGKLLNQDLFSLQMLDSKEQLLAFEKSDLQEYGFVHTPPMPSYRDKLNAQETADLISFLAALKGAKEQ